MVHNGRVTPKPRETLCRALVCVTIALLTMAAGACGDEASVTANTASGPDPARIAATGANVVCAPVSSEAKDALVALVTTRAQVHAGAVVTGQDDQVRVRLRTPIDAAAATALCRAPRMEFRAVLDEQPTDPVTTGAVPSAQPGVFGYEGQGPLGLGPAARIDGRVARHAEAITSAGKPLVSVDLTDIAYAGLNELAAKCFEADATCPSTRMAVVYDGRIAFAGSVQAPRFDSGVNVFVPDGDEPDRIAAILNSGADDSFGLRSLS